MIPRNYFVKFETLKKLDFVKDWIDEKTKSNLKPSPNDFFFHEFIYGLINSTNKKSEFFL
jgi:hypothetical protein